MAATYQLYVMLEQFVGLMAEPPRGWTIGRPTRIPQGVQVEVMDAEAPEELNGKQVDVIFGRDEAGRFVSGYALRDTTTWVGNRTPAQSARVLAQMGQHPNPTAPIGGWHDAPLASRLMSTHSTMTGLVREALDTLAQSGGRHDNAIFSHRVRELESALADVLRQFHEKGHPGKPCLRTGWVDEKHVQAWREALEGSSDTPV